MTDGLPGLIGNTPLVRLQHRSPGAAVLAKCEQYNPGGSLEDRAALAAVDAALASGQLLPGGTVVASSLGNFALALALVGKARHVRIVITVPEGVTGERVNLIRAYGAEVVRAKDPQAAAEARAAAGAVLIRADHPAPFAAIGHEILAQLGDGARALAAFVSPWVTGASLTGCGEVLRAATGCRLIAVGETPDPAAPAGWPGIQGMALLATVPAQATAELRGITASAAYQHKVTLAKRHGLLVGHSAGAAFAVATEVAAALPPEATVVVLLADTGERYFALDAVFAGPPVGT